LAQGTHRSSMRIQSVAPVAHHMHSPMASSQFAYLHSLSTTLGTPESDDDFDMPRASKAPWMTSYRMIACMVGIAISGTALLACVRAGTMNTYRAEIVHIAAASKKFQLSPAADPCDGQPHIKLSEPNISKNGNTLIVFPGVSMHPGRANQEVLVVVNATKDNADLRQSGLIGKYVFIQARVGTKVQAHIKILDKTTRNPVKIRELDITFVDIDRHGKGQAVEHIEIKNPDQYFLTKGHVVDVSEGVDGRLTFKATQDNDHFIDIPCQR